MTIEEQTSAFMDRALSPNEEAEFLHILSVSPDKREVFRSFNNLRFAVQEDIRSTSVPPRLDQSILAGIAASTAAVSTIATGGKAFRTFGRSVLITLGSIIIFAGGFFLHHIITSKESSSLSTGKQIEQSPNTMSRAGLGSGRAEKFSSIDNSSGGNRIIYRNVENPIYITRIDTVYSSGKFITRIDTLFVQKPETILVASTTQLNQKEIHKDQFQPAPLPLKSVPENFEVGIQREHLQTYPYIDYARLSTNRTQQNLSIDAAYRFNQYHAVGITFGEKTFSQSYYEVKKDSVFLIQQQPTFTYGGLFYRFSLPLSQGVVSQVFVHIGSTSVGPVVGAKLAIALSPFEHFNLLLGGNSAMLIYKLNENVFTSYTLGLFYGVQYQF